MHDVVYHNENELQSDEEFVIDCIQCDTNSPSDNQAFCTFLVGSKQKSVKFKLDTGSQVNILPKSIYKSLGGYVESLDRPNETLSAYNNNRLESLGCCHLKCVHQKGKYTNESTLAFHVVDTRIEKGIKFNKDNLEVGVTEVKYFGHLLTDKGLKPDPDKVRAVQSMKLHCK